MKSIDRTKVRNITEQTTRKALNKQQLSESGLLRGIGRMFGRGAGKAISTAGARQAELTRGMRELGRRYAGRSVQPGLYQAQKGVARDALAKFNTAQADAMRLASNAARTRGLGYGLLGGAALGGLGGYALGSDRGSNSQPIPNPSQKPFDGMYGGAPYPGHGGGYDGGYSDPYAGYGGGHGGWYDPYAGYGYGGWYDPYAGYGGDGISDMDPMMMMYLMQQGGNGTSDMDPMMMMMNQY